VSGALILIVAAALSHLMMSMIAREQELGVRRLAAVYLDGISTTVYPHVVARNLANTIEALRRTTWFHQSMREQRALVRLPDGSLFADVAGPDADTAAEDPYHSAGLQRRLRRENGFVLDVGTGTGWASRAIIRNGQFVADLYVALELKPLIEERRALRRSLLEGGVLAAIIGAAVGFLIVAKMVWPVRLLTRHLRRAQMGDLEMVPAVMLPPANSEYGRLIQGYNDLVAAFLEREALAARLAERERESVLGRLAATVAHEVRNPLGGMSTALDTIRKFGSDPDVRAKSLDLVERGLWSIRDVVNSVLAFHRMPSSGRALEPTDLEDLRLLIGPELTRRGLSLRWQSHLTEAVDVPATEVRQIALNLLLNACDASPTNGEVAFETWIRAVVCDPGKRELVLEVADEGPGLPPGVVAALTEIGVTDPRDPPRGLGVRVVRDLVASLGGRTIASTGSGHGGSHIVVTLPLSAREKRTRST
jgi:signal transduction histidine kinase